MRLPCGSSPILAAACLLLSAAHFPAVAQEQVVTVGFVGDFSEVSKGYTHNMFQAFELALDEINAAGGVLGRPVRVVQRDAGNDPQRHAEHVKALADAGDVVAIFGGASSPCVLQASAVCRDRHLPYLVSIGNSQSVVVEHGHPYVFLFEPTSAMESKGFSIFLTLMPWHNYAWVGPDYMWGRDVLAHLKHHFAEIGAPITWTTEAWHPLGTTDYHDIVRQISAGQPEALVIASWGEDARHLFLEADREHLFDRTAVFAWFTYDITEDMGRWLPTGMWLISRGPFNYLAEKHPLARRFVDQYHQRYDAYPNGFTICCYDSVLAWHAAVRQAGSVDPVAVAAALRGLEFDSLRGLRTIRAVDGQMDCPAYFGRIGTVATYPYPVWQAVIEVPAAKIWLSQQEVLSRRAATPP